MPDTLADDDSPDSKEPGQGAPMALDDGAAGGNADLERGHVEIARVADAPGVARDVAKRHAARAGMLGTELVSPSTFTALASTTELTNGFDPSNVEAPLYGGAGDAAGAFGFAHRGLDASAGCVDGSCGTIGIGRYGTLSNGRSAGTSWGGHDIGGPGPIGHPTTMLDICGRPLGDHCTSHGPLDFDVMRRLVRRHHTQLLFCYEHELLAKPDLHGEVIVEISIEGTGSVLAARATGVDDAVSACVARVVHEIQFPREPGGDTEVELRLSFRHPE